jgi:predicted ATPase
MRLDLPAGTVTFMFTDIEGSTALLHELGSERYGELLSQHHWVCRVAWAAHGGVEVDTAGDAFFVAFPTASSAIAAASDAQDALAELGLRVRIGIRTGEVTVAETGYVGFEVHRAARIASAAHGGQVVVSGSAAAEAGRDGLVDLGEHRFKDVQEPVPIFQLGEGSFPPLKTMSNTNLPRPASSFVGREVELDEVLARVQRGVRLVTLTGPGGSGKTRLALEAAATLVPEYKAGVFWVGLAALRDPGLVTETIAQTLGAKDDLAQHIGEREMLLLLDNLEQVIESASELSVLLRACPNLALLVTSRELLRVEGEVEYQVAPLAELEAVALFCERAQTEPKDEIGVLCTRLDNLPLAVELAAARTKALSPAQILERLAQRLDLLTGRRDTEPRQQTLRATIEWSHDLLTPHEQRLFRALSVFAGGCTLDAAESIADAELDTLQSLVEKSLLSFSNDRYWMLETIREYASEMLEAAGETPRLRQHHSDWFQQLVRDAEHQLTGLDQVRWLDLLDAELDNLRATLSYLESAPLARVRMATSLWRFWQARNHLSEGQSWLIAPADLEADAGPELAVRLHIAASRMAWKQADFAEGLGRAETAYEIASRAADDRLLALAGENLGVVVAQGDAARGHVILAACVRRFRCAGDEVGLASALNNLGYTCLGLGKLEEAAAAVDESILLSRSAGNAYGLAYALHTRGFLEIARGRHESARSALEEALVLFHELRDLPSVGDTLDGLGHCAGAAGATREAVVLWAAADAVRERAGFDLQTLEDGNPVESALRTAVRPSLEAMLGADGVASAQQEGRALGLADAIDLALGRALQPTQTTEE